MTSSAALCTYNGEKYIKEQITSILHQSKAIDEIIVVDDCSSDNTVKLITAMEEPRISMYQNENNLGYVKNFEKAVKLCSSDVIFLCDQDDIWKPEKVELSLEVFEHQPQVSFLYSDAEVVDSEGRVISRSLFGNPETSSMKLDVTRDPLAVFNNTNIKGCLSAVRSGFAAKVVPFSEQWGHDHWIAVLAYLSENMKYLDVPLVSYRRHAEHHGIDSSYIKDQNNIKETLLETLERRNAKLKELKEKISEIDLDYNKEKIMVLERYMEALALRINLLQNNSLHSFFHLAFGKHYRRFFKGYASLLKDVCTYGKAKIHSLF